MEAGLTIGFKMPCIGKEKGCCSYGKCLQDKAPKANPKDNRKPVLIWDKKVPNTQLEELKKIVEEKYHQQFANYWEFHEWSIAHFAEFWEEVWKYFDVIHSKPYEEVYRKTGDGFLDCEWFVGARFNFAENLLRIRDDSIAIIYADEYGYEEKITFREMFEETKRYAAAFKKNGLKKGDCVACYMSNRKESVYTLLACASIGAIFGGPQPYFGPKPAINIIQKMDAKFLLAVDHHPELGVEYHNIDYLPEIVENCPCLEKVIIVPTKAETLTRDISNIKNSCLLEDFLDTGKLADGSFPDIVFEQLPFSHPFCINFTSGTTGLPKGPIHSAGSFIPHLASVVFYWNLKKGDVIHTIYPVGWTLWDTFVPCLAWGVTLFLHAGNPLHVKDGKNVWDLFSQYKVTYSFLATSIVDKLEKYNMLPGPNANLDKLKIIAMGGSPVKAQNYLFVRNKIKKDVFVCSQYGSSEAFGTFSGFDMNLPCYAGELQSPALAMDVRCFDEEGKPVLNKRGEMVIASPSPSLPIYLWKDEGNAILKETYLSKYPGVWCQNDEIWINAETKGYVVIGRSDDTLIQNGDRFGAGDIYFAIHSIEEIQDSICVSQQRNDGDCRAVLFVKMRNGSAFTPEFREKIQQKISDELWYDCVPEAIMEVPDIPYNLNNKKMESIIRKIIATNKVPDVNNIKNPECLRYFCDVPEVINYSNPQ